MKKLIKQNKLIRQAFKKLEINRLVLKLFIKNNKFPTTIIWNSSNLLSNTIKKNSICLINNCCIFTGKSVSLNLKVKMSRIFFLKTSRLCYLYGIKKIYW